ncbi:beta strand repeat-containing protein [Methanobrevibacter sp. DSM 116169]|uniref:beta strand repeat-containing protein n=1 Tax=Methanobrevibacter sp. DSM 116169 TaxID=3242727 RepID=UPI0038FD110D
MFSITSISAIDNELTIENETIQNEINYATIEINDDEVILEGEISLFATRTVNSQADLLNLNTAGNLLSNDVIVIGSDFSFIGSGFLNINGLNGITIDGQGHTINANFFDYVFRFTNSYDITVKNLTIINGYNGDDVNGSGGGAIRIYDSSYNILIDNCTFENNTALREGGAIRAVPSAGDITIKNSIFRNNTAQHGGAVMVGGGTSSANLILIGNNVFENNRAIGNASSTEGAGGAIDFGASTLTITGNNIFRNNTAYKGGAIRAGHVRTTSTSLIIDGTNKFYNNTAASVEGTPTGGAIYLDYNVNSLINGNNEFINNSARSVAGTGNGGAITLDRSDLTINGTNLFDNNRAANNGGALYASNNAGYTLHVTGRNEFYNNFGSHGGALNVGQVTFIDGAIFENNTASWSGGGAIASIRDATITNCIFEHNLLARGGDAANKQGGGALSLGAAGSNKPVYLIENCTFKNNYAYDGGAIGIGYANGNVANVITVVINNNTFINNTEYNSYGAINTNSSGIFVGNNAHATVSNNEFYHFDSKSPEGTKKDPYDKLGIIYNMGKLYLENNIIESLFEIKIYNYGQITSEVNITFFENKTEIVNYGDIVNIPAWLVDDMGNRIAGLNITFRINGTDISSIGTYDPNTGIYYINYEAIGHGIQVITGDYAGVLPDFSNLNIYIGILDIKKPVFDVNKTIDITQANVGDIINYTITIKNIGDGNASEVNLTEYLPEGLEYYNYTNNGLWTKDPNNLIWSLNENLTSGNTVTLTILFKVVGKVNDIINNTVNITSKQDPEGNNTTSTNITITNVTLDVIKIASVTTANVGDIIEYNITVYNRGNTGAHNVSVTESIPNGLDLITNAVPGWQWDTKNKWTYNFVLAAGGNVTLILRFKVSGNVTGNITNVVTVKSNETKNITNNTTIKTNNVTLEAIKKSNVSSANVGDLVEYNITIKNVGSTNATGVYVIETLPDGLNLTNTNIQGWIFTGPNKWTYNGTLEGGKNITLTLIFKVTGNVTGLVNNTITVKSNETNNVTNNTTVIVLTNVTLDIIKKANVSSANVGDLISYNITVYNRGSTSASEIYVIDYSHNGLELVSNNDQDLWVYAGNGRWNYTGVLASKGNASLILVFRVLGNVTGVVNNTVVTKSNETKNSTNNTTGVNVTNVNLTVVKVANVSSANVGDLISYNITVTNIGTSNATGVYVIDYLHNGLELVSNNDQGLWVYAGNGRWNYTGVLASKGNASLILVFRVLGNVTGVVNNTVVTKSNETKNSTNNTTGVNVTNVNLTVVKVANVSSANVGDLISYNITVTNIGTSNATGVYVIDYLHNGLELVSNNDQGLWVYAGNGRWNYTGVLASKGNASLILVFRVLGNVTGVVNNTVVTKSNETKNSTNNTTGVNVTNVNLTVVKVANVSSANVGDLISYNITVTNIGTSNATGVYVIDYLHNGLELVSNNDQGLWVYAGNGRWNYTGVLASKGNASLILVFRVLGNVTGVVNNTVVTKSNETKNSTNNTTGVNVTNVNLTVVKVANVSSANVGDLISYNITVTNIGTSNATGVYVIDYLHNGLELVSNNDQGLWVYAGNGRWNYTGVLASKGNASLILVFRVLGNVTGVVNNTVVTKSNETKNSTNNTTGVNVTNVNLTVVKVANVSSANVGDLISYNITVTNIGTSNATGVYVIDYLHNGLELVSNNDQGLWVYAGNGRWNYTGVLASKGNASLILVFRVLGNVTGVVNNTVVTKSNETKNSTNNTTGVNVTNVNLTVVKVANVSSANVGDLISYNITVTNIGTSNATGVYVIDYLHNGLELVSNNDQGLWVYAGNGRWNYTGVLASKGNASLILVFRVLGNVTGVVNNTVVTKSNETKNSTNNTTGVNVTNVNLTVVKVANVSSANVGDLISYNITVTNIGTSNATGVYVIDYLHNGLELVSNNDQGLWVYAGNGRWNYTGVLAPKGNASLILVFRVLGNVTGVVNNTVVTKSNETKNSTNNTTGVNVTNVNLTVVKVANVSSANIGDLISYNITVTNIGTSNATGVYVIDYLHNGLELVSNNDQGLWVYAGNGRWNYTGVLASKGNASLILVFRVLGNVTGVVNNTVVTKSNETKNSTNNTTGVNVTNVNLTVVKVANVSSANVGDLISYNITVTNIGTSNATGVYVIDYLHNGLELVSNNDQGLWVYAGNGRWNYTGVLAPKGNASLILVFRVLGNVTGVVNNTVVTKSNETKNSTNNTTGVNVTNVNLTVVKVANVSSANIGDLIEYNITVTNVGSTNATGVYVVESLPDGLDLIIDDPWTDWVWNNTNKWTYVGNLTSGESVSLILRFRVLGNVTGQVNNTVTVKSNETKNSTNNTTDVNVTNVILDITKKANTTSAIKGDIIEYNITVFNKGNMNATGVYVTESLPDGLQLIDDNNYGKWIKNGTNRWDYNGTLENGTNIVLTLRFRVLGNVTGQVNNTVTVKSNETKNSTNNTTTIDVTNVTLEVIKSANVSSANIGDLIEYNITVTNVGSTNATVVKVTESFPDGLNLTSYNVDGWTFVGDRSWTYNGNVTSGESVTLTLVFKVLGNVTGQVNNTVTVKSNETKNSTNNTTDVNLTNVTLSVIKSANVSSANIGDLIEYNITVTNVGSTNATVVKVTESFPDGLNLTSYNVDGWTFVGDRSWTYNGNVTSGESVTLTLVFKVLGNVTGQVNNTVTVKSNETKNSTNNTTTIDVTNVTLEVIKSANVSSANIGDLIEYNITVTNVGSTNATVVKVTESFPDGLNLTSYNVDGWTFVGDRSWTYNGNVTSGESVTLTLVFKVLGNVTGQVNNTVTVKSNETKNSTNNTTDVNLTNVTLEVIKSANVSSANIGDLIEYNITVTNVGSTNATVVKVTESFPDGLNLTSYNVDGWTFVGDRSWTYNGNVTSGESVTLTLVFKVLGNVTGQVNNTVTVKSNETKNSTNNTTDVNLTNVTLEVIKSANVSSANIGDLIEYNITVTNVGSTNATVVKVTESFPDGLNLTSYNVDGWTFVGDRSWTYNGNVTSGESVTLTLVFKVLGNVTGQVNNTVTVKSNETKNSTNNTTDVNLTNVTLSVIKSANVSSANIGDLIEYNITVTNVGSTNATVVKVTESFPDGLNLTSYNVDGWTFVGDRSWTYNGNVTSGESVTLTLVFKVLGNVTGQVNNTVTVKSNETKNSTNNTTGVNVTNVNLSVIKSANVSSANIGDLIEYNITVTNVGSTNATVVKVTESFPDGLNLTSYNVDGWTFVGDRSWTYNGNVTSGESVTLTLVFKVLGNVTGQVNNTVTVKSNETKNSTNNTTDVNLTNVTLSVIKSANVSSANIGDLIEYNITVTNVGSTNATVVKVTESFPDGLNLTSYNVDGWTFVGDRSWTYNGNVTSGESVTLTLVFKVLGNVTGQVNNTVTVKSNETKNSTNNTTGVNVTNVNLSVIKSANVSSANIGDLIEYNITVTNVGSTNATVVKVTESFPDGLNLTSYNVDGWTFVGDRSWTYNGNVTSGESVTLTLVFKVLGNVTGQVNNTVTVKSNETKNSTNNTTDVNLTNVTLSVIKSANVSSANVGDLVEYNITVTNVGSTNATVVTVSEVFPDGLNLTNTNVNGWTYNGDRSWTYNGNLTAGENVTLTLVFKVLGNVTGQVNNTVTVKSNETKNSTNNTTDVNLTNVTLSVIKSANVSSANVGDLVEYNITVTNVGSTNATVVKVTESFPDGLNLTNTNVNGWTYNGDRSWTYNGNLTAGENVTLTLVFKVLGNVTGQVNNTVTVKSNETKNSTNNTTDVNLTNVTLDISKIPSNTSIKFNEYLNYTIIITNLGTTGATGITVIDQIPVGLTYVGFSGDGWYYDNSTGKWIYNNVLAGGNTTELVLTFLVNGAANVTYIINNTVNVTSNQTPGGNNTTSNNTNVSKLHTVSMVIGFTSKAGQTVLITGTVYDEHGDPITGPAKVTMPNGEVIDVSVVNGMFSFNWTVPYGIKIGYGNISVAYDGNEIYYPSNGTNITLILKLHTNTTVEDVTGKPGENVIIRGNVTDENGNTVPNGTVILTLPDGFKVTVPVVDGKFEYPWTIPKNFKKGKYPIHAEFLENEYYYGSNGTGTLTVIVDPTPGPTPTPTPSPNDDDNDSNLDIENTMEKTGNPIALLLLVLISGLLIPLRRKL